MAGYRSAVHAVTMAAMSAPFSIESIHAHCNTQARQVAISIVAETGSTNVDLLAALENLDGPCLLIAEAQTAGKGRAGRTWHSEPGATLTFSLAWKFDLAAQALLGLPLAVGVVIAEALAQFEIDARLKWPNDVLLDGQKLAGVLIETANAKGSGGDQVWAVIGIGINIGMPESLAIQIGRSVAAAPSLDVDRNRVVAALLNGLADAALLFEEQGFKAFRARWNKLHAYSGQQVTIIDRGEVLHEGRAVGVDDNGRLLLDVADQQIAVVAGDVSLRRQEH
jgi:BirA family biotin operon repressor/biotin-[acetyl-CoA-carboxylase] ligase